MVKSYGSFKKASLPFCKHDWNRSVVEEACTMLSRVHCASKEIRQPWPTKAKNRMKSWTFRRGKDLVYTELSPIPKPQMPFRHSLLKQLKNPSAAEKSDWLIVTRKKRKLARLDHVDYARCADRERYLPRSFGQSTTSLDDRNHVALTWYGKRKARTRTGRRKS